MTNRDRLLSMSLYDLIMSANTGRFCRLAIFEDKELTGLCRKHKWECGKCVQEWLNMDERDMRKLCDGTKKVDTI